MKIAFALVLVAALAGCATTSGTAPTTKTSGFDGARVVNITPHGNACTAMTCTGLGMQWSSANPNQSIVTVSVFNEISAIRGAILNIDGEAVNMTPLPGITQFSRPGAPVIESSKSFVVPLATLRRVAASHRVWVRAYTPGGYVEDAVIDGATDSKAYHALHRFLSAVDGS